MKDFLISINAWYQSKCDSTWEHSYGYSGVLSFNDLLEYALEWLEINV